MTILPSGGVMRTTCLLAVIPFLLTGCLTPITGRLDRTNDQLEVANQRLGIVNAQLAETTQRLAQIESQLAGTNQKLEKMHATLEQTDRRLEVVEKVVRKFGGIKPD